MFGDYQRRELGRQLAILLLLLGIASGASYLINNFDLLPSYQRFARMPPINDAGNNAPADVKPVPGVAPMARKDIQSQGHGVLAGVDSDGANYRYFGADGSVIIVKAFCSRLTLYTKYGNYSMVYTENIPSDGSQKCSVRTFWKNHRDESMVDNGKVTQYLNTTLRFLCPLNSAEKFQACNVY